MGLVNRQTYLIRLGIIVANQYKGAIHYAVEQLADDLKKYPEIKITTIQSGGTMIRCRMRAVVLDPFTQQSKCLAALRKFIRDEKKWVDQKWQRENQTMLDI